MDITWLGHSCFRIHSRDVTIITDPPGKEWGLSDRLRGDIVTVSHRHPGHDNADTVSGSPLVVGGPGEYESKDVLILGIGTYHDASGGEEKGKNTVYLMELEALSLCHLGAIGHVPTAEQVEALGDVDILLIPVGGATTINAAKAAETISLIEPKIVVPMHYHDEQLRTDLEPLDRFLREVGAKEAPPQPRLSVTRSSLPQETQIVVLERHRA